MLKTEARTLSIRDVLASTLTIAIAISCVNREAIGAPSDKPLTPEQFTQQRDQYLRYQKYVQAQMARMQQTMDQQKQQQQQLQKQQAAQKTSAADPPKPKPPVKHVPIRREDVLLVMPAAGAKGDEIRDAIEGAQGEICGGFGGGSLRVILVKARPGTVVKLQRALAADTRLFKHVDFNRPCEGDWIPTTEPTFPRAWHIGRMKIHQAWDVLAKHNNFPMPLALFDTGVQGSGTESWVSGHGADATGKVGNERTDNLDIDGVGDIQDQEQDIIRIGNNIQTLTYGIIDQNGHGTKIASLINGSPYNRLGAAGVNPQVPVFPVKIADGPPDTKPRSDDLALIKAMCVMYDAANTRIINISYSGFMKSDVHPILHEFFKDWYYRKNGLIFISAGNAGESRSMRNEPYISVVSMIAQKDGLILRENSGRGTAIDYTAPGEDLQVVDQKGEAKTVDGTSYSTPLVAAVASMIWTINPKLKNTEVEKILRDSCENRPTKGVWNSEFGWGMPNAFDACTLAEATVNK